MQWQEAANGSTAMLVHLGKHWLDQNEKTSVEVTGKDGGPIKQISVNMSLEEAAQAYADTLKSEERDYAKTIEHVE